MSTLTSLAERLKKSRPAMVLAVVILGTGIGVGLSHLPPFDVLELKSLDLRFPARIPPRMGGYKCGYRCG